MNTKSINRKLFIFVFLFAISLIFSVYSLCLFRAEAAVGVTADLFHPASAMEYKALTSPIDSVFWEDKIAVVQGEDKTLIVYDGTEYVSVSLDDPKQVKKLGNDLIISDNGKYLRVSLSDLSASPTELKDTEGSTITGAFFDTNGKHLVSIYSTTVVAYKVESESFRSIGKIDSGVSATSTVCCINSADQIFYVDTENNICRHDVNEDGTLSEKVIITQIVGNVTYMIANTENIYYILSDNSINSVPVNPSSEAQKLSFPDCDFDLGKANFPISLSFKGNNLLITASGFLTSDVKIGAVQEFAINGSELEFTGFAVSKGLTAYNRISANAKDISQSGNTVAVLDDIKLTVITDTYDGKRKFNNYLFGKDFDGFEPNVFAMGENTVLLSSGAEYAVLNLEDGSLGEKRSLPIGVVSDICYQSGYYYLLGINTNNTAVYKMHETDADCTEVIPNAVPYRSGKMPITVDVDGNVYLADDTGPIVKYAKNGDSYNSYVTVDGSDSTGVADLGTDLAGGIFALKNNTVSYYYNGGAEEFVLNGGVSNMKSMSMNFDKNDVYFILNGEEIILATTSLPNVSLEDVEKTADYKISGETADCNALSVFTVADGANVYSVTPSERGFDYNQIIDGKDKEFILVCDVVVVDQTYSVLAGENDRSIVIVIVNGKHLTEKQGVVTESDTSLVYITTSVSMYYLPIISENDEFCLAQSGCVTRLQKKTSVEVLKQVKFLNRDFYFIRAESDGNYVNGYVPVNFTVPTLSENALPVNFEYRKLSATAIYSDDDMTNVISQLDEDTTIKLFSSENGVAFIAYQTDGGWITGYVRENAIKSVPNATIRNVLIILAVTTSVAVTSIYFIVRKKD